MRGIDKKQKAEIDAGIKDRIAEAVVRVFEKRHPEKLTVEMIAQEVGMSKGALYKYFADKDELIAFAIRRALASYQRRGMEIAARDLPFTEKLLATAKIALEATEAVRDFLMFAFKSASNYSQAPVRVSNERRLKNFRRIEGIMREGLRNGTLRKAKARDLMLFFGGIIRATCVRRANTLPDERQTFTEDAAAVVRRFMFGVAQWRPDAQTE